MVMKTHFKSSVRLFKKHFTRLITIVAIVFVSIGFMAGIGEVEFKVKTAANKYYQSQNISDIYIKSKNESGFSKKELAYLTERFGKDNVLESLCYEMELDSETEEKDIVRLYNHNLESSINQLELLEGEMPKASSLLSKKIDVVVERQTSAIKGYEIGDTIMVEYSKLYSFELTVCGIVRNPLIINQIEEPSFQFEDDHLDNVVYIHSENPFRINDVYITLEDRTLFNSFSDEYEREINRLKTEIESELGIENVSVLSLYENFGMNSLIAYGEKVREIGIIFVVFFLLVTLLVVYSTMSRLFDEERAQIACLKTLGYSNAKIISKYTLFVFIATAIGGGAAFELGLILTKLIYTAFNMQYAMPPFPTTNHYFYYLLTLVVLIVATFLLTFATGMKLAKQKPVALLTPKAPKAGKKVIIERIPFIWNHLSFKHKSTMRNVLLFKSRFLMTVVSVLGSTVLVLSGMGLTDCSIKLDGGASLIGISLTLIVCSALLCALVVYNLTNINVSERTREIATLMVLGYDDKEVTGYIFREVYIMSFIGAVLGLPVGVVFLDFVFNLVNFGSVADINWWTWILTPILTIFFTFLSTRLLYRKITKTDMNASLKTLE